MEYNSSGACNSLPSGSQVEFGAVAGGAVISLHSGHYQKKFNNEEIIRS